MQTLVLCDDHWHPALVPREGLSPLKEQGFAFDWIEDARDWSAELMAAYPLVILTKSNHISSSDRSSWMTDDAQSAFADYVHKGNGLLAIHSGTADYQEMPIVRSLLGGVFTHHPEQCAVTIEPKIDHQLTMGISSFTVKDEHYFIAMNDTDADVFMTTHSEHGEQPAGWRRTEGTGRVAVLTPGHNLEVWLHPSYQALLLNALRWCGGMSL
ncbi:MAG: ThuA domain-containing protein [Anaerolineae bacterium]|nr:ThuA domain-containing protein [Anaerolineae bacterium]